MQSWWMQMTDTDTVLELREAPVPQPGPQAVAGARARRLAEPRRVRAGPWPARQGRHAGRRSAARAPARSSRSVPASRAFKPGDRVMGRCAGAFSEYALMEAGRGDRQCQPALSWEEAASIPLTFLVSYDMLVLQGRLLAGRMAADQRRVVGRRRGLAAAGQGAGREGDRHLGLGRQAGDAEAARTRCRPVHARSRFRGGGHGGDRPARRRPRRQHGRRHRSSPRTFAPWPSKAGSPRSAMSTACCTPTSTSAALHAKRLTLFGVSNKLRSKEQRAAAVPRFVAEVLPHIAAGRIKPRIDQVFDFARLKEAKARMEAAAMSARSCCACPSRPDMPEIRLGDQQ